MTSWTEGWGLIERGSAQPPSTTQAYSAEGISVEQEAINKLSLLAPKKVDEHSSYLSNFLSVSGDSEFLRNHKEQKWTTKVKFS